MVLGKKPTLFYINTRISSKVVFIFVLGERRERSYRGILFHVLFFVCSCSYFFPCNLRRRKNVPQQDFNFTTLISKDKPGIHSFLFLRLLSRCKSKGRDFTNAEDPIHPDKQFSSKNIFVLLFFVCVFYLSKKDKVCSTHPCSCIKPSPSSPT